MLGFDLVFGKWGRIETVVDGTTTYVYKHRRYLAADDDTDWYATRIVTDGNNNSIKNKRGSFANYDTEDWGD